MTKRLLYLGNGPKLVSNARIDLQFERWGFEVDRYWAFDGQFPSHLEAYDAIFLSGSPHGAYEDIPFIHRECALIREAAEIRIPMLGVCFGSQILGAALCGRDQVFRRRSCEIGYAFMSPTNAVADDRLLDPEDGAFLMFVWHNDEVRDDHADMVILASTADCPNHIWRYREQCVWGIQGHPELGAAHAETWFEQNRQRMELDGADVDELIAGIKETPVANRLPQRFARLVLDESSAEDAIR